MRKREPTSPGEILREEFLSPLGLTQRELADHLGCDVKVINRIVNGRSSVSAEMAIKLGAAFATSPEFWLNAQKAVDLYRAERRLSKLPPPLPRAS
jgi:addiction module HigA family antidote